MGKLIRVKDGRCGNFQQQRLSRNEKRMGVRMRRLTCDLQGGIAADGLAQVIPSHAHVHPFVGFAASPVNDPEEEERAAWEQHAVGPRILTVGFDPVAILVPFHHRGRPALCFTI